MDVHNAFRLGAEQLARGSMAYGEIHRSHGLLQPDWELFTQGEPWTPEQARRIQGILGNIIEVCLTISGMPAVPLPGQYAAAVIAICVGPANRMLAANRVPETFDAVAASGLLGPMEVRPMKRETMMALVLAYSGGFGDEPPMERLPSAVKGAMVSASAGKRSAA